MGGQITRRIPITWLSAVNVMLDTGSTDMWCVRLRLRWSRVMSLFQGGTNRWNLGRLQRHWSLRNHSLWRRKQLCERLCRPGPGRGCWILDSQSRLNYISRSRVSGSQYLHSLHQRHERKFDIRFAIFDADSPGYRALARKAMWIRVSLV